MIEDRAAVGPDDSAPEPENEDSPAPAWAGALPLVRAGGGGRRPAGVAAVPAGDRFLQLCVDPRSPHSHVGGHEFELEHPRWIRRLHLTRPQRVHGSRRICRRRLALLPRRQPIPHRSARRSGGRGTRLPCRVHHFAHPWPGLHHLHDCAAVHVPAHDRQLRVSGWCRRASASPSRGFTGVAPCAVLLRDAAHRDGGGLDCPIEWPTRSSAWVCAQSPKTR